MPITPYIPPSWTTPIPAGIWAGASGIPVFPYLPGQSIAVSKSPQWSTKVSRAASARERTTQLWPWPLWNFEVAYEVVRHNSVKAGVTLTELATMWEFFNAAGAGKYGTWLFVDPSDYQVATPFQFATGTGTQTQFTLTRPINSWVEPVYAAYNYSVYVNGVLQTYGSQYTASIGGGITFASAPASGAVITWTGYFYYGCRFDQDDMTFKQMVTSLWSQEGLKFVSKRAG